MIPMWPWSATCSTWSPSRPTWEPFAECGHAHAVLVGPLDRGVGGESGSDVAKAAPTVDHDRGFVVAHDLRRPSGIDLARAAGLVVLGHPEDAV